MKKKALSLLLALTMCLSMLPAVALADNESAKTAPTATVGIYLRTLDKTQTSQSVKANFVNVPAEQLQAMGLVDYYYSDTDGYWIDYGSFESATAASCSGTQNRDSEKVKAVVNELQSAIIAKKTGINLDLPTADGALTWDTLSWSQNSSRGSTWHLNGELHFYKAKFDLNYTGADNSNAALTRYEVVGTDINSGLPPTPTRENYIFDGWYTEQTGGTKVEEIPELTDDVTYYAHWKEQSAQEHKHTVGDTEITFQPWNAENSLPTATGNYYLTNDVTITTTWEPMANVNLCLNGHSITATGNFDAITVSNSAEFTLTDCQNTQGIITHESGKRGRGVHVFSGTFNMYGGNITGNIVDRTALSNAADDTTAGGGVRVANGTFNMYGGKITNNTASANGGGVDVHNGCEIYMYGGTISGNVSKGFGGGINNSTSTTFTMTGGTITGNTAMNGGGGVHLYDDMTISGNVEIYDNYKVTQMNKSVNDNIYLDNNANKIIIGGTLSNQQPIGVTTQTKPSLDNPTSFATHASDGDKTKFTSDVSGYTVVFDNGGLYLKAHQWEYTADSEGKKITATCSNCHESGTLKLSAADVTYNGNSHAAAVTENAWQAGSYTVTYSTGNDNLGTVAPTNAGEYTATLTVGTGENAPAVSVDYTIAPATLTADDFNFAAPSNLMYDGHVKSATVTAKDNVTGIGRITVKYYKDNVNTEVEPKDAGTYMIKIDVAEGANYNVATGLTANDWTFTITPAVLTVTPSALSKTVGAADPELTYTVSGAQNGETPAFTGTLSRAPGDTAGTYAINQGNLALKDNGTFKASNYTLNLTTVNFTINNRTSSGGGHSSSGSSTPKYTVSVPSGTTGGTVKSNVCSAAKGSTVTVTVTPQNGYKLDKLTVIDEKGNTITATDKGDNKYTFTMPSSKVTVMPSFSKIEETKPETSPFDDVTANDYFYDAVKWAAAKGITGGVSSSLFAPEDGCTRAQIVTFLWRTAGSPEPSALSSFNDVPSDKYYAKAVAWAVENGITVGTTAATFSPDDICTRAHGVTFLYRAAKATASVGASAFTDVADSAYYADAVKWATEQGITKGISSTLFGPDETCTRAQIVTFLYRLYGSK